MTYANHILAAAVLIIAAKPVLAADDACSCATGARAKECQTLQRVPDSAAPCKILSFCLRERYKQCLSAEEQFSKVQQGLALENILKLAICTGSHDWKTCLGVYVTPVPKVVPDPGPYVQKTVAGLSPSDRTALHETLRAAIDANAKYLTAAVDEIYGRRGK